MKAKVYFSAIPILLLSLFLFTGCKKKLIEYFSSPAYVSCNLNGKRYEDHYRSQLELWGPTPDFYYHFRKGRREFTFNFTGYPEEGNTESSVFYVSLCLFLDEPLTIETSYNIAVLTDSYYDNIDEAIERYKEKKQSYCIIESSLIRSPFCFGNGFISFSQICNPNEAYLGKFGFVFSPLEDSPYIGDDVLHLSGDFFITNSNRVFIEY